MSDAAVLVDQAIHEAVGSWIELAARLDEAAFGEGLSLCILDGDGDRGLIHVALFGDARMSDALVVDDDRDGDMLAGVEGEGIFAEGRDEAGLGPCGRVRFDCDDVHIEDVVLEEGDDAFHLLVELVVLRHDGVGAEPLKVVRLEGRNGPRGLQ